MKPSYSSHQGPVLIIKNQASPFLIKLLEKSEMPSTDFKLKAHIRFRYITDSISVSLKCSCNEYHTKLFSYVNSTKIFILSFRKITHTLNFLFFFHSLVL